MPRASPELAKTDASATLKEIDRSKNAHGPFEIWLRVQPTVYPDRTKSRQWEYKVYTWREGIHSGEYGWRVAFLPYGFLDMAEGYAKTEEKALERGKRLLRDLLHHATKVEIQKGNQKLCRVDITLEDL